MSTGHAESLIRTNCWLSALMVLLAVSMTPKTGFGWDSPAKVVQGTARVLDKGEMMVGILTPLGYGIHERVTLFTHLILDLLLTPNIWARMALLPERAVGVTLEGGCQQSFLSWADKEQDIYPGYVQAGVAYSYTIGMVQVTAAAGYEGN